MSDDTMKRWRRHFLFGTVSPALLGLWLMSTDWFQMPAEAWEFAATACTFLFFCTSGWACGPKEEPLYKKESLLMSDVTKKRWLCQLFLGTLIPAVIGLILMLIGKFEMPAESREGIATICTLIFFCVFHYRHSTLHSSDRWKEKKQDAKWIVLIVIPAFTWAIITFPWFVPSFNQYLRLVVRCLCGIIMFRVILWMNCSLWKYWKDPKWKTFNRDNKDDDPDDHCVRSALLLCMVDLPIAIGLVTVILGCLSL